MNHNYEQQNANPYDVNYTMPDYYVKYNQEYLEQPNADQQINLNEKNSNVSNQPLIDSIDSLEYTSSISNSTPGIVIENENNQCEKSTCIKCFCLFELIIDIIGLIIYFVS